VHRQTVSNRLWGLATHGFDSPFDAQVDAVTDLLAAPALLVYDGDCGFCAYWVRYWQRLTGQRVRYAPYQQVAADHPALTLETFASAIQWFGPGGERAGGAEAAFRVLAAGDRPTGLRLYRRLSGFAPAAEGVYALTARHRVAAYRLSRMLWGRERVPERWQLACWLFLRLLGLFYFAGFVSIAMQLPGLIGSDGILPATEYLDYAASGSGWARYWEVPSLFWLDSSDTTLMTACLVGAAAALLVLVGRLVRTMLVLTFVLYLSLWSVMPVFGAIQSDALMLEAGFLGIFLTSGSSIVLWLYRWLLFRFMLVSGVVKLFSHDQSWANLTALDYHYETQPLPTPLAWYAHQLPEGFQEFCVLATLGIELILPWLVFMPRHPRMLAAWGFILLQTAIALTGNYHFLNLIALALCLFLFDDHALASVMPGMLARRAGRPAAQPGRVATLLAAALALVVVPANLIQAWERFGPEHPPAPLAAFAGGVSRFGVSNLYGFFGVMTTERREIVLQGSDDGEHWRDYELRYKPGDPQRCPRWSVPHQPRLDWQMWFAALGSPYRSPWLGNLMYRLLDGTEPVLALFANNPFPDAPPRYVRGMLYLYRFTDPEQRAASGACWVREPLGPFTPTLGRE
jgi:predicted DCC family thiol-disulfide oxidoreductase YuxK